jgi:hypothetical protein
LSHCRLWTLDTHLLTAAAALHLGYSATN